MSHLKIYYILMENVRQKKQFSSASSRRWLDNKALLVAARKQTQIEIDNRRLAGWKASPKKQTNEQAVLLTITHKNEIPGFC